MLAEIYLYSDDISRDSYTYIYIFIHIVHYTVPFVQCVWKQVDNTQRTLAVHILYNTVHSIVITTTGTAPPFRGWMANSLYVIIYVRVCGSGCATRTSFLVFSWLIKLFGALSTRFAFPIAVRSLHVYLVASARIRPTTTRIT